MLAHTLPTRVYHSTGAARLSGMPTINTRILFYQLLLVQRPFLEPCSDTKTLRSLLLPLYLQLDSTIPRFMDPPMPPDHRHILNIVTPLYQCSLLWIMADISAWRSQQSSGADLGGYKEIITCESCIYVDLKYPHPRRRLKRV